MNTFFQSTAATVHTALAVKLDAARTKLADDRGMTTIEYALVQYLHHESTHHHTPV